MGESVISTSLFYACQSLSPLNLAQVIGNVFVGLLGVFLFLLEIYFVYAPCDQSLDAWERCTDNGVSPVSLSQLCACQAELRA